METPRTRLEQRAMEEHLSVREFCAAYHQAGTAIDESVHVSDSQAKRWLSGTCGLPRGVACRILEHWWNEPVDVLFGPPTSTPVHPGQLTREELLAVAAREASQHAVSAAAALGDGALEHLHAEVRKAARAYFMLPPLELFAELVRLQRLVREQLDRTGKPRQQAELYLALGQISGLMSSLSWALGDVDAAEQHACAAHTYGHVIDQPSLCAWARALHVTATFWAGCPRRAVDVAATALDYAPAGTARARLHAVRARALALVGARDEVRKEVHRAADQLDYAGTDDLLDGTGGELGFSPARQALCASTAYVVLGDAAGAEQEATAAVARFAELPEDERWPAGIVGAYIDLATARAMQGEVAGAEHALIPVFDLQPTRRTAALTQRLHRLGRTLTIRELRSSAEARRINDRIEGFTAQSLGATVRAELPGR